MPNSGEPNSLAKKFCRRCGNRLSVTAKFCNSCGESVAIDDDRNLGGDQEPSKKIVFQATRDEPSIDENQRYQTTSFSPDQKNTADHEKTRQGVSQPEVPLSDALSLQIKRYFDWRYFALFSSVNAVAICGLLDVIGLFDLIGVEVGKKSFFFVFAIVFIVVLTITRHFCETRIKALKYNAICLLAIAVIFFSAIGIKKNFKNKSGDFNAPITTGSAKDEAAAVSSESNTSSNFSHIQNFSSALSLENDEKTKFFISSAKEETQFVRSQKPNSYFLQFGAFNSARECFDYQNDYLENLEFLYVRSDSPRFLRIPIITKDKKPAIAIVFGPFDSIDDARNEVSGDGVKPPKYWVRSTKSLQDALVNF